MKSSEANVRLESFDFVWRKVLGQLEVFQTFQRPFQTTIVTDGLGLVKVDVRVTAKLVK